ncbi:MAG: ECF-type sigma factor [Pseudomonadota bacterium]
MHDPDPPLTQWLAQAAQGERAALDRVFAALYPELRKIAHARLRARGGIAQLDTTSLVHEGFLRRVDAAQLALADRKHFFTYAANAMRSIVIDLARGAGGAPQRRPRRTSARYGAVAGGRQTQPEPGNHR